MTSVSKTFFGAALLALLLFACSVDAHGWMSYPSPRGQYKSEKRPVHLEYEPAAVNPNDPAMICRNDPEMPKAKWLPLTAGKSQAIQLEFNAIHPGDCFVYLTYDGDKPQNQMKWFKIWQQHECYKQTNYNVPIPSYLPSGEHVIFRWEWYALHAFPTVEYYTQCVDAVMTGASSGAASGLPQPQVNIPGHLPSLVGDFLSGNNNYWWPYDNQPMFYTGPALASLGGSATDAPTVKPTNSPTRSPTYAPPTNSPTYAPPSKAPTTRPTDAPTSAPSTAPTTKPTSAPTVAPPSVAPTTRPTDAAPTSAPPAQSVKLVVNPGSSVWWFACSLAGHRSTEVTKFEIKDSGKFSSLRQMNNEWGNVFVFNPVDSALVLPLTVKVSLASGSSLSFTVNSIAATTIDSGAVFP